MIELFGNIWNHIDEYDAIVITTNGTIKKNGEAVMGRGIAKEAKDRYPALPRRLGLMLLNGNETYAFWMDEGLWIITLPVKPARGPNGEPGWKAKADLRIIERSVKTLSQMVTIYGFNKIIMPRPGCGNGGLSWEVVKPVIEKYLDDRFVVMEKY